MNKKQNLSQADEIKLNLRKKVQKCEEIWLTSTDQNLEDKYFEDYMAANNEWVEFFEQHMSQIKNNDE